MKLLVDHHLRQQKHCVMLTLDEEEYDKLQYIVERTQFSLEHVVKWALDAYFAIVFSDREEPA